mgnify:CR=1 FL=1
MSNDIDNVHKTLIKMNTIKVKMLDKVYHYDDQLNQER